MVNVLSLFSGVGGFDIGLENAGMRTIYQCEWDKHARSVLDRHWPDVPKWGDISTLTGAEILRHGIAPDVVAWGSPCQDMSVAGAKAGLSGERSSLFYEGMRIIKELRELTNGQYPRISIWENVAGALLSGGGSDFGQVLYEMDEAGACFSEWAVLDAQYFGVPQRRKRVFLTSVFDPAIASRCPNPLFPVAQGLRRGVAESGPSRQGAATTTEGSLGVASPEPLIFANSYRDGARISKKGLAETLSAKMGTGGNNVPMVGTQSFDARFGKNVMVVRRLTPIECERLMGWPDNWTAGNSDTQRYKQCGNGVASPVAQWVGKHVIKAMEEV